MVRFTLGRGSPAGSARRLKDDERGMAAVEFAIVAMPFMMVLFGIMSVCMLFFATLYTENAVWVASRDLRTGIFQTAASGSRYAGLTGDTLKNEFKKLICERTANYSDCMTNMRVLVQARTSFSSMTAPNCLTNTSDLVSDTDAMAAFNAGAASSVVMVTACYKWRFGGQLPFLKLGNMADGSLLIQASASFRTEPYN